MLKKLKSIFLSSKASDNNTLTKPKRLQLSAAALLVEAALMDENFDEKERSAIISALMRHFELDKKEAEELVTKAEELQSKATDLHSFTRSVNDSLPPNERQEIIQMLWKVVYADGSLDQYEAALIRKLSGLLHVRDSESADARKKALNEIG